MEKSNIQNILAELTNTNLVILGLSVTIFTVIYSFLVNKKNELNALNDKMRNNQSNPFDNQQKHFALTYIKKFKAVNQKLLHLIAGSSFLFITIFISNRFLLESLKDFQDALMFAFFILTAIAILYFLYVLFDLIKKYKNELLLN